MMDGSKAVLLFLWRNQNKVLCSFSDYDNGVSMACGAGFVV
jgi:hypothetical protein